MQITYIAFLKPWTKHEIYGRCDFKRRLSGTEDDRTSPRGKKSLATNTVIRAFYVTDLGYYPKARYHYRVRKKGANEHRLQK